jgi:hypothetical protein
MLIAAAVFRFELDALYAVPRVKDTLDAPMWHSVDDENMYE